MGCGGAWFIPLSYGGAPGTGPRPTCGGGCIGCFILGAFAFWGDTAENPCCGIEPTDLGDPKPDCLDADFPKAPPRPNTGRRLDVALGGGGKFEGGGSSLLISGEPLPSSASSKISLATKDGSLSTTIPPLFGNSGAEDTLPKDFFALGSVSALGGIPEENAEPPPTAPFRGAFPNEEGAAALDGISPPPPKGLLLSSELLEGALPKEEGAAALGGIPEENAEPPPPAAPFRGAFPNEEGAAALGGIPEEPKYR